MNQCIEQYGIAVFTLILVAILIACPLGMKIKNATTDKVSQTEQIGKDEITETMKKTDGSETGGSVRPEEPAETVSQVYCIYYDDGEMTISQNEIEPEDGRTVKKKGFYSKPNDCTFDITTIRFIGAVKPKSCYQFFYFISSLKENKNIENLYTNECRNMAYMFYGCAQLTSLDVSHFDTSNVTSMSNMFCYCRSLTSLNVSNFDIIKITNMQLMFGNCDSLQSITATQTVKDKILSSNASVPSDVNWTIK